MDDSEKVVGWLGGGAGGGEGIHPPPPNGQLAWQQKPCSTAKEKPGENRRKATPRPPQSHSTPAASLALWLRRPPGERKIPGLNLACDFSGSSHTSDLKIGTPVATLPVAWR